MISLRDFSIVLVVMVGIIYSQELESCEHFDYDFGENDTEYRPWLHQEPETWPATIFLDGMGITNILGTIRANIFNLKWLIMDDNRLTVIPDDAFKNLSELTYLSLANNHISEFAIHAFDHLHELRVIDLDGNPINRRVFNGNMFNVLPSLKRLYLRNSSLPRFDLPPNMDNLTHLYLSDNQLDIFYTKSESALTHLFLDNNWLCYVSVEFFNSLVFLDLSGNRLIKIVYFVALSTTYIARNFYYNDVVYQPCLRLSDAPSLQYLIVSCNEISEIAADAFSITRALIHVDFSKNKIGDVKAGTFNDMLQLENILLDSNRLRKINYRAFVNLPKLKVLSLKNNLIDDIDEYAFVDVHSTDNEMKLFLDNNRIHILKKGSFRGITGLKHIGLSNNRIKTISSQAFANLPNLESIVIENQSLDVPSREGSYGLRPLPPAPINQIIESDAFFNLSNLGSITIRGNIFTRIQGQAFNNLPSLIILDLSNNSIEHLSPVAFSDLPKVEDLNLEKNLISNIDPETFPEQLKKLNLAENPLCKNFICWQIGELHHLEELNVSGIVEHFKINDVLSLPENLTVIVG